MRWFHWLTLGILAVVLFAIVELAIYPSKLDEEIRTRVEAVKATGAPTSTSDLQHHIPSDRNAALVYVKAVGLLPKHGLAGEIRDASEGLTSGRDIAKASALVRKYDSAIRYAEQASKLPECGYPIDWNESPFADSWTYYNRVDLLARIISIRAQLAVRNDKPSESMRYHILAFDTAESLRNEPVLLGFLIRLSSLLGADSKALKDSLHREKIDEGHARELYDLLEKIDLYKGYRIALVGDRARYLEVAERVRHHGFGAVCLSREDYEKMKQRPAPHPRLRDLLTHVRGGLDERDYLDQMQKVIDGSSIPYRLLHARHLDLQPRIIPIEFLASNALPPCGALARRRDQAVAEIDGYRILLALLAFKDRHHAYPKSLAELRDGLGWKIPQDIFSGKDFHYRRSGKGFLLYSIGLNLKDDGGLQVPVKLIREKGDMVWKWDR